MSQAQHSLKSSVAHSAVGQGWVVAVGLFMEQAGVARGLGSEEWCCVVARVAGQAQAGTAAEVARGVQEGGRARRRRRQHGRQRALAGPRGAVGAAGGRALHVGASARRHGSPARQHVLRLGRPAIVRQPAPYHYCHETDQQR